MKFVLTLLLFYVYCYPRICLWEDGNVFGLINGSLLLLTIRLSLIFFVNVFVLWVWIYLLLLSFSFLVYIGIKRNALPVAGIIR